MAKICLNCNNATADNYCSTCSQSVSTHRFSLPHIFNHDLIHGIFHIDKGFFYTLRELVVRPGDSIREYVEGKRVKHFNYFATVMLLMAIGYFLRKWATIDTAQLYDKSSVGGLMKILKDYGKVTIFLHIPIIAFASYVLFRKSGQNFAENLVLNTYLLCGVLMISFILLACMAFSKDREFLLAVNYVLTAVTFIYVMIFYYRYFSAYQYKRHELLFRALTIALTYMITKQILNNLLNYIGTNA